MIVSLNPEPNRKEFNSLINLAIQELNVQGKNSTSKIEKLLGRNLEPFVKDVLTELAIGTPFQDSIELIGGQKFPDIIANKYYGIEVKTTTQNHWKTTGNSVLESTRVEDVERIFMLFAKLAKPIEFRCRPYEDVLSEVVVTHSPRYLIDMNLEVGKTIFDKINIPYDTLRKKDNPIKSIVEYYKSKLKQGEELWWMDTENSTNSNSLVIRIWNNLPIKEKQILKNKSMVYFPELFGNRNDKFGRLAVWLVKNETIVCPNLRDLFTAGGKNDFSFNNNSFNNVPRIFINLFENIHDIIEILNNSSANQLSEFWDINTSDKTKIFDWIDLISENSKKIQGSKHLNIKQILTDLVFTQ